MLKFWKKSGSKDEKGSNSSLSSTTSNSLSNQPNCSSIDINEDDWDNITEPVKFSRLSKPLVEILRDTEAIGYFIQYLETLNAATLARCLLDIENFNLALEGNPGTVLWSDVKGVRKVEENGVVHWEFFNDSAYTNNVACDISGYCQDDKRNVTGSSIINGRTIIRATSEARLSEMQKIEAVVIAKLSESDRVSLMTVDALRIFYKYFSYSALYKLLIPPDAFYRLVNNFRDNITKNTFLEVRNLIFTVLEKEFYNEYLRSECHCKYQISLLTGSAVLLSDILYNESILFYFMEFLEIEGCRVYLEFWMAANNFLEQYSVPGLEYDHAQAQSDAMVLYDKYFSLQATNPLHLGDKVRFRIEDSICGEDGPQPTCFVPVQRMIVNILEKKYLTLFLQSQLYFKYLSELISTVNAGPSRPSGSDCSSEVSISLTNTLLACENGGYVKKTPDLNIDNRSLYDPDSLWRRSKQSGLTFGRVNAMGRFQTDLEPEPDKKIGFETRITKAVKKFVNQDEDKTKEEMAWQVAEMIVKDVTNLTMPSTDQ